ncbi:TonB-dependent receptor [uncultured Bacteroides sp.]|uniref:SusC/RagA family TonB-linked outer membrane protein n=1 Tax=uncultured Bacteroides sp. TaxID=162156 RepID=UPI002AABC19F|nr:TonB-dependent receptor [uncultured Bacteroides sp.]
MNESIKMYFADYLKDLMASMKKKTFLLLMFLIILPTFAFANVKISGTVVDESGKPLIGVTILERNAKASTVSDFDGKFTIEVTSPNSLLVFSYIGFETQTLRPSKTPMLVTMKEDVKKLEEIVVVAYGRLKKVTVTGAVAAIDRKEILKSSAPNLSATLAGKLPGLTTIQSSGEPGRDDVTMFLRGAATTNGTSPLILVDGVPRSSIREIDPNEIATVSVLKDASATAVFGVRGANGVILITTRRGEKGSVTVTPSVQYSIQSFSRTPMRIHSWDYARLLNEACDNDGVAHEFSDAEVGIFDTWKNGGPTDAVQRYWYPDNYWRNIIFKNTSRMVRGNVNISGGTDKLQFFVNTGYLYQGGMYNTESKKKLGYDPQSTLNRYNFRSNVDYTFSKYVKATVDLASYIEKVNGTNGLKDVIYADALSARPTSPGPMTVEGFDVYDGQTFRPVRPGQVILTSASAAQPAYGHINRSGYQLETRSGVDVTGNLNVDLNFLTPGLSMKGQVSFQSRSINRTTGNKNFVIYKYERNDPSHPTPYYLYDGDDDADAPLSISRSVSSGWYTNLQFQTNYTRTFDEKHSVNGMVLVQRDIKESREDEGYQDKYLPFNVIGIAGRLTYAFDNRYLAEFNAGYNGSEQFSPDKRFGFFPAWSVGWVISNEKFMKSQNFVSNLKLRMSYGKVGNDSFGGYRFLYLDNIGKTGTGALQENVPSIIDGVKVVEKYLGNKLITWETAWKQNYGIDLGLLSNEFNLSFDYFYEKRSNILINRGTVPDIQGLQSSALRLVNMGKVDNKGFEINASYKKIINKDFGFNISGNFAYTDNKIKFTDEAMLSKEYAYRYRATGFAIGQCWGYKIDRSKNMEKGRDGSGFFYSDESIKKSGLNYKIGMPKPGDFIYQDLNGDGDIDDKDLAPIGYSSMLPKITYGFNFGANYKGFDFSVLFQGVGKYSKFYDGWGINEAAGPKAYTDMHLERWSAERYAAGEKTSYPRLAYNQSTSHLANDFFIMDASYIRLKNAEFGYTIPSSITKRIGASDVRVYMSGENLVTWQNLRTKSFDPEQANPMTYPTMRTFNFGVNLRF